MGSLEILLLDDEFARSGIPISGFFIKIMKQILMIGCSERYTAREFIKKTDSIQPRVNEKIRRMFHDAERQSVIKTVNLKEWALKYQSDSMSIILPTIETTDLEQTESAQEEKGEPKKDIRAAGYAIFDREGKLIDFASLRFSRDQLG